MLRELEVDEVDMELLVDDVLVDSELLVELVLRLLLVLLVDVVNDWLVEADVLLIDVLNEVD